MLYFLIIKGDKKQAKHAAQARGIPLAIRDVFPRHKYNEVSAETSADPDTLNHWLCEQSSRQVPYPVGSLLFWSPMEL